MSVSSTFATGRSIRTVHRVRVRNDSYSRSTRPSVSPASGAFTVSSTIPGASTVTIERLPDPPSAVFTGTFRS